MCIPSLTKFVLSSREFPYDEKKITSFYISHDVKIETYGNMEIIWCKIEIYEVIPHIIVWIINFSIAIYFPYETIVKRFNTLWQPPVAYISALLNANWTDVMFKQFFTFLYLVEVFAQNNGYLLWSCGLSTKRQEGSASIVCHQSRKTLQSTTRWIW